MPMKSLKLAAVQFNPEFNRKRKNFDRIERLTEGLDADIIVLPELCTTGYFFLSRKETTKNWCLQEDPRSSATTAGS